MKAPAPRTGAATAAVVVGVTALYLLLVFPLSYFRHDDWQNLSNATV